MALTAQEMEMVQDTDVVAHIERKADELSLIHI